LVQELNDFGFGEFAGGGCEHAGGSGGEDFAFRVEDEDDGAPCLSWWESQARKRGMF
jgi:hypothetical protein